ELVITNAMLPQHPHIRSDKDRILTKNCSQLNKITRELQDLSISMRMVPLKGTFKKMTRLVRDLARKSGKEIRFLTEGEETEIDRNMVESLSDPLVHMIRNACDHGIEHQDFRRALGKFSHGTLILRAYHSEGNVHIELQDDGRGLDRDKILNKARKAGLVGEGKELTDGEIYKFIFSPGFSTADEVTELSGRGVGMDVVKQNVEAMRGRVEVHSTPGVGSVFTIRIPLTLAIIDGMLVRVGTERYIVPTLTVKQALQLDESTISTVQGRGEMVMLRSRLIPLFRLHRIFNNSGSGDVFTEGIILILEYEEGNCALLVDELLDQQQVVIKSLGKGLGDVKGISGAAILGDGQVGLILDVAGIFSLARKGVYRIEENAPEEEPPGGEAEEGLSKARQQSGV
ncbi:MAG: chemotaxis protein CheA, partial [Planctomycetota bacterium]